MLLPDADDPLGADVILQLQAGEGAPLLAARDDIGHLGLGQGGNGHGRGLFIRR